MFANTNIFTDKETTNWFKACIALIVTKDGLSSFVESELQKIQTTVGRSCGNCSIEKLLPCPTNGICKKRKGNTCIFHQSQQPQNCKSCDQVKQNITSLHRFNGPSWRNTQAELWATQPWEIGKCFLPPDGYSGVSSVQESDFNGVISIMLNCTHFQTCLSSSCLSPPPPDKQCLLEKVRQIGRDIRHTSDCKVSDAHLQNNFQTLSTLLADPKCLLNDPSAKISKTKLGDLQNDRMSLSELGELLKEADRTLKNANEVGERVSEAAERKLAECLEQLEASLQAGEKRIQSRIDDGKQRIEQAIQDGKQHIGVKIQNGERCIESKIDNGKQHIEQTIQDGEKRIEAKIQDEENRIIQTNSEQAEQNYTRSVEEMLGALMIHYDRTLSHFPSSPLNDWFHARLDDVYMPPNMLLMEKKEGSFKKTQTQITKYQNVLNQQTFIQGEAGSGKSSFLAKLVMDWCGIAKTTQTREPVMIQETNYAKSDTRANKSTFFDDLTSLKSYKFVFYITLRDSVKVFEILQMIKEQLIDEIYSSQEDREKAYRLVNEIMKHERCLVLLDGLDEWKSPDDRHHLPTLVAIHTQCDLVITTRPWKLAEAKIPDSKIETLLHLEGVNEPFVVSLRILRCREDCTNSEDVENKHSAFVSYVDRNDLRDLLASPMLLTLIVQTWAEGTELKGNKCQIYSLLLESLFKKANSEEDHFHKTPFPCLKETRYIKPNIEHFNRLSEAAFHLLFSETKENSLVFGIEQLIQYKLYERKDFVMRTGILSATRKASALRSSSSFSFVHKSVQEFLAAYYIACNCHVIDEVIPGYLKRHDESYRDMHEVLIFLCGLNISAANELSILMNNAACDISAKLIYQCVNLISQINRY
ncbi:uncharacterized protein LOC127841945 isoform X1 [Dreissena polymorpha]|uniref:NACHT domain-containing protein n=2 Tax=Dreissena polymorpha TaxID=45954 RepID=A0A9D4EN76_DREPO|nr:uncharacterized protein LOC127841945 isoform X1 [Dreissena polymorpha]XP_052227058.1 uncharacterized protein LOC127841945 isoform X1 [Dreissena polymorpha]XP_052227059.1 uncharacterized protein LOC127841945 isoform X1 [Dreissena polymorpha]XP_052227060.1 uncharacterized protein LOC127841945 isoform X1 [Dreissena polymorpha]XP_052227061.1 uncharacterized protein LOC127841945 isoform X1 [Dreissena polymorpha]XP_052227062.1 uncharacterized protein LOC127841945 isoform X1 [Dreissena polymorpha]